MNSRTTCAVPNCTGTTKDQLHCFPKSPRKIKIWLRNIGNEELLCKPPSFLTNNYRICRKHFLFVNERVGRGVIPTLFLPGKS